MSKCCIAKPFTAMRDMLKRIEALEKNSGTGGTTEITTVVQYIPPVGSIQIFANEVNPETLYEGTVWEQLNDTFLYAASSSKPVGTSGGTLNHSHGLSTAYAKFRYTTSGTIIAVDRKATFNASDDEGGRKLTTGITPEDVASASYSMGTAVGGDTDSATHLPPFTAVAVWKRTA